MAVDDGDDITQIDESDIETLEDDTIPGEPVASHKQNDGDDNIIAVLIG
jgi:hypothetical protein